jgi:hypothetical protein
MSCNREAESGAVDALSQKSGVAIWFCRPQKFKYGAEAKVEFQEPGRKGSKLRIQA